MRFINWEKAQERRNSERMGKSAMEISRNKDADRENGLEDTGRGKGKLG